MTKWGIGTFEQKKFNMHYEISLANLPEGYWDSVSVDVVEGLRELTGLPYREIAHVAVSKGVTDLVFSVSFVASKPRLVLKELYQQLPALFGQKAKMPKGKTTRSAKKLLFSLYKLTRMFILVELQEIPRFEEEEEEEDGF
jgi:hypothetical protein